jgi:hypothetical protein
VIVSKIREISQSLSEAMEFVYGNGFEVNNDLETLKADQWYFLYFVPEETNDTKDLSNGLHTKFPFNAYIVKKVESSTSDYKSEVIQPIIDRARDLGRQFIHKLDSSDIIDTTTNGIESVKYVSQYGYSDTHLFGVWFSAEVPIYEGKTGCVTE